MELIPVIGLELHAEMKSTTKVFSKGENTFIDISNNHVAPLDMAFPGTLPDINFECMKKALEMSIILNCEIPNEFIFDRKNYYYPDLPKGYQITQSTKPIGINGEIDIEVNGNSKKIKIHDIHLEEDSASLDHYSYYSLIDYNRAGVPLLEIVTEPCLHSSKEALAFLETIRNIYRYTDISDADAKKGQVRCDVNVSLMKKDSTKLGTKVEIKNVNSFANVVKTIECEIERQENLINSGRINEIVQETRRYDEENNTTLSMRSKADAIDYKYFIEPNIPSFEISNDLILNVKSLIPELPNTRKIKYIDEYGLSITEANNIIKDKDICDYFEELIKLGSDVKISANWVINQVQDYLNSTNKNIKDLYLIPSRLKYIIDQVLLNKLSNKQAKELFIECLNNNQEPDLVIKKLSIEQINDEDELKDIIIKILDNNIEQINAYKNGKTNMFDYFVGQAMKQTKGKANPVILKEILNKELNNR